MLNTSLICLSLKYLSKNYELISNISNWVHFESTKVNYKETKLIKSLDKKDFEIIKILIKFNKNINLLSEYLNNYHLYRENYFNIVKLLIENGGDIHIWDDYPLKSASFYNQTDIVKLLIENGADIHAGDNKALKSAISHGNLDLVDFLMDNGANICTKRWNDCRDIIKSFIDNENNKK